MQSLFIDPVIRPEKVAQLTGLSLVSAYKLIVQFEDLKILREITGGQRNRIYPIDEYFKVFDYSSPFRIFNELTYSGL